MTKTLFTVFHAWSFFKYTFYTIFRSVILIYLDHVTLWKPFQYSTASLQVIISVHNCVTITQKCEISDRNDRAATVQKDGTLLLFLSRNAFLYNRGWSTAHHSPVVDQGKYFRGFNQALKKKNKKKLQNCSRTHKCMRKKKPWEASVADPLLRSSALIHVNDPLH